MTFNSKPSPRTGSSGPSGSCGRSITCFRAEGAKEFRSDGVQVGKCSDYGIELLAFRWVLWFHVFHYSMSSDRQYYWGALCLCSKLHPVKLATSDPTEKPPAVQEFLVMCPNMLQDIRFDLSDIVKYSGPSDEKFQTHQLFQESHTTPDHD